MLTTFIIMLLLLVAEPEPIRILFWNLENFFDYFDGGTSDSDREFSARGVRHWTKKRFLAKCNSVAKAILWMSDQPLCEDGSKLGMPDIIALAEVENKFVLKRLLSETSLRKYDYAIVHHDSPDRRGIDVALLYRQSVFDLLYETAVPVRPPPGRDLATRDILLVQLQMRQGAAAEVREAVTVLVNHHPSKFGGGDSDWRREAALDALRSVKDSLWRSGERTVVAIGDFNDTPDNQLLAQIAAPPEGRGLDTDSAPVVPPPFVNLALPLAKRGEGTIRYQGKWELIDIALAVPTVGDPAMKIIRIPFLMVRDNTHAGEKPLRTYVGPRYSGGVSDHLPVLFTFNMGQVRKFK